MSEAAHVMQYIVVPYRAAAGASPRRDPPRQQRVRRDPHRQFHGGEIRRRGRHGSWWTRKPATWDRLASWRRSAPCPRWTIEPAAHERTGRRPSGLTRPEVGKAMSRHGLRARARMGKVGACPRGIHRRRNLGPTTRFPSRCALVACVRPARRRPDPRPSSWWSARHRRHHGHRGPQHRPAHEPDAPAHRHDREPSGAGGASPPTTSPRARPTATRCWSPSRAFRSTPRCTASCPSTRSATSHPSACWPGCPACW